MTGASGRCIWALVTNALSIVVMLVQVGWASETDAMGTPVADEPIAVSAHYEIDIQFAPADRRLTGSLSLQWTNWTGVATETLPFRLYPASDLYEDGDLEVDAVQVNGKPVESRAIGDGTVLEVSTGDPVEPGERVTVSMDFATTIPTRSGMSVTVLSGSDGDGWWLADWYPVLAGWEPGSGWYVGEATPYGDPTYSDSATYAVTLTTPGDLMVVGTGQTHSTEPIGSSSVLHEIATGPVREMTLSLLPNRADAPVEVTERQVDDVLVRVSLPSGKAVPGLAEAMLDVAAETLPHYQEWLGAYPGEDLDLSPVSLSGFGGIAWSGAVWLDIDSFVAAGEVGADQRDQLRFVLAHELAHQWIPVVVGSNNNRHGFMSEGLASTLAVLAIQESGDLAEAERSLREMVAAGYLRLLESGRDGVADAPVQPETDMGLRGPLVYGKAAIGFEAIRQAIGHDAFVDALQLYGERFRFGNTVPGDLRDAFEDASGMDLDDVWSFWFREARTTPSDVQQVLDAFVAHEGLCPEYRHRDLSECIDLTRSG